MGHREPDACPWLYVDGIGVKTPHSLVASTARQPKGALQHRVPSGSELAGSGEQPCTNPVA